MGDAVRAALKEYEKQAATLVDVSLPLGTKHAVAVYYLVATAEASSNLARFDGMHYGHRTAAKVDLINTYAKSRGEGLAPRCNAGSRSAPTRSRAADKSADYLKALKLRRLILDEFTAAFEKCDVIAGPTSPTAAFKMGEKAADPLAMYLSDIYTISCNLAGIAGISLPCGFTKSGLPIGLQLLSPPFDEERMFRVARMYESVTDWHTRRPKFAKS